jgi:hypothetical protein
MDRGFSRACGELKLLERECKGYLIDRDGGLDIALMWRWADDEAGG